MVDGIALMESTDSVRWLVPNNFVITNAQILRSDPSIGEKVVKTLAKKKVSGIALKLNRFIKDIPPSMRECADSYNLPIIALPYNITSTQIINAVTFEIFRSESHNLEYSYEADFLRDLIFENVDKHILRNRMANLGWSLQKSMGVTVIKDSELPLSKELEELCVQCKFPYVLPLKRYIIAITEINSEAAPNTMEERALQLYHKLKDVYPDHHILMGVGIHSSTVTDLANSFFQAKVALCLNMTTQSPKPITYFGDIGVFSILLSRQNIDATNGSD